MERIAIAVVSLPAKLHSLVSGFLRVIKLVLGYYLHCNTRLVLNIGYSKSFFLRVDLKELVQQVRSIDWPALHLLHPGPNPMFTCSSNFVEAPDAFSNAGN